MQMPATIVRLSLCTSIGDANDNCNRNRLQAATSVSGLMGEAVEALLTGEAAAAASTPSQRAEAVAALTGAWASYESLAAQHSHTIAERGAQVAALRALLARVAALPLALLGLEQRVSAAAGALHATLHQVCGCSFNCRVFAEIAISLLLLR